MSSPAAIAGIVVAVVIGTPLVVAILIVGGYIAYKYILRHRSLLPHISLPNKSSAHTRTRDNGFAPLPKNSPDRVDFDNEAFLNAVSSREVDPDQQSQSLTQNTLLSIISKEQISPIHSPLSPALPEEHVATRPDQVTVNLLVVIYLTN